MRFIASFVAPVVAMSLLAAPAMSATITTFTPDNVKAIVAAAGGTKIEQKVIDDVDYVMFDYNGLSYAASTRFCDAGTKKNCAGLMLSIAFQSDSSETLELINTFHQSAPLATAVKLKGNLIAFGRFVLATGGISDVNVAGNLGLLVAAPQLFAKFKGSQVVASNGVGSTVLLSQPGNAVPELKNVKMTDKELTSLFDNTIAVKSK